MRLLILSAGRWHKGPERALYDHYANRFGQMARRLGVSPLELQEIGRSGAEVSPQALLAACPHGATRIALEATGASLTSGAFTRLLDKYRTEACPTLAFLIGGADGLAPILPEVHRTISLGAPTWPHLLVRGMLAEQIYRAATILLGHPYHLGHERSPESKSWPP